MTAFPLPKGKMWLIGASIAHAVLSSVISLVLVFMFALLIGELFGQFLGELSVRDLTILLMVLMAPAIWISVGISIQLLAKKYALPYGGMFPAISAVLYGLGSLLDLLVDLFGMYEGKPFGVLVVSIVLLTLIFFLATRRHARWTWP